MQHRVVTALSVVTTLLIAASFAPPTRAESTAPARAQKLLETLEGSSSATERRQAADELAEVAREAVPAIAEFLGRERDSSNDERRELLRSIKAAVPGDDGHFLPPRRQKELGIREDDEFDWLASLLELEPGDPGLGETIADVAAVRALAASEAVAGADAMLDLAFSDQGIVYRDEIGRYLRKMEPYSIPTLVRARFQRKSRAMSRYARYQLERLARENPSKALAAAAEDERLIAAILRAYQDTKFRQAVEPVLDHVDHISPIVRKAAREAWLGYVTGPPPPPAPKKKLKLPGGEFTEEPEPLWLTYRELAEIELEELYRELFGEAPPRDMSLEEQSRKLFAHYDAKRDATVAELYAEGTARAEDGEHDAAVERFDRILAVHPRYEKRAHMAPSYLAHARALEKDEAWREASAAYSKAHTLAPQADSATRALAGYHYTLGRALEAEGKDGRASFARATALDPSYAPAREAAERVGVATPDRGRKWMLYAGIGGGAGALLLLALGLGLRKRH